MAAPKRRPGDRLLAALAERFVEGLVQGLAETLGASYAFLAEPAQGGSHFRTLALW